MIEKIKQILKNKKLLFPLAMAVCLFTFLPNIAHAAWFVPLILIPVVTGVITGITATIAGLATKGITLGLLILGILSFGWALSWAFMQLGLSVLNWGISGTIFAHGMSMTNPANNEIINIGWTLLRDLTNMFFILGLAYIGLATALDIAKFDTKKTFVKLIIIALLINFTPVICGLIVDASNIIMNFFLSEVDFNQITSSYKDSHDATGQPDEKGAWQDIQYWVTRYFLNSLYGMTAGAVLMIFGLILLMRHFIIWILVILSPLAFFLYIFDFSRQWYQKWWGWFVSWSFIGLPAAFFLYLANHLMILAKTNQLAGSTQNDALGPALSPYLITIVFMVIALIVTLKIRTAGSSLIMNTANKVAGKAKALPGLVQKKVGAPIGAKAGAVAGVATAGGMAALGAGYKMSRDAGEGKVASLMGGVTNWAKNRGGLSKKGAKEGLKLKEESRKGTFLAAERLGLVKPGYYEEDRAKRLDTEAETKRLGHLDKDRQEEMLKRYLGKRVKTDADMKIIMALERNKAANQVPIKDEDVQLIREFGYMDPKAIKEVSKAVPHRAHELDPKKYEEEQEKLVASHAAVAGADAANKARIKMTKDKIQGMTAADFAKYFQVSSLNSETAIHLDVEQIKQFGKKASAEDRITFGDKFRGLTPEVIALATEARAALRAGQRERYNKIISVIREARGVNFQ